MGRAPRLQTTKKEGKGKKENYVDLNSTMTADCCLVVEVGGSIVLTNGKDLRSYQDLGTGVGGHADDVILTEGGVESTSSIRSRLPS